MVAAAVVVAVHGARSGPLIAAGAAAGQRPPMPGLLPRASPVADGPPATAPDSAGSCSPARQGSCEGAQRCNQSDRLC